MRINNQIKRMQDGGTVDASQTETPQGGEQQQGQDPIVMLAQMAQQALQNKDANMAFQVCQGFLELVQQMSQGQGQQQQGGEPVYRKGGKIAYRR